MIHIHLLALTYILPICYMRNWENHVLSKENLSWDFPLNTGGTHNKLQSQLQPIYPSVGPCHLNMFLVDYTYTQDLLVLYELSL